jgi:ech hydrogenase subunit A
LILKLSPVLAGTLVGATVSVAGMLVFAVASYLALAKEQFKEILGLSTIAMLGLMVSMAALGSEEAVMTALLLMLFHALAKALLFLGAGVLEKLEHAKSIEGMKGLIDRSPLMAVLLVGGFMSMTLPPFGLFVGKLLAIETIAAGLHAHPWLLVNLLGIALGGVLLSLLYFKVASALLSSDPDKLPDRTPLPFAFGWGLYLLAALSVGLIVVVAAHFFADAAFGFYLFTLPLLIGALLPLLFSKLARFDRVREYHCGEVNGFDSALFYYEPGAVIERRIFYGFSALFGAILLSGVIA